MLFVAEIFNSNGPPADFGDKSTRQRPLSPTVVVFFSPAISTVIFSPTAPQPQTGILASRCNTIPEPKTRGRRTAADATRTSPSATTRNAKTDAETTADRTEKKRRDTGNLRQKTSIERNATRTLDAQKSRAKGANRSKTAPTSKISTRKRKRDDGGNVPGAGRTSVAKSENLANFVGAAIADRLRNGAIKRLVAASFAICPRPKTIFSESKTLRRVSSNDGGVRRRKEAGSDDLRANGRDKATTPPDSSFCGGEQRSTAPTKRRVKGNGDSTFSR